MSVTKFAAINLCRWLSRLVDMLCVCQSVLSQAEEAPETSVFVASSEPKVQRTVFCTMESEDMGSKGRK